MIDHRIGIVVHDAAMALVARLGTAGPGLIAPLLAIRRGRLRGGPQRLPYRTLRREPASAPRPRTCRRFTRGIIRTSIHHDLENRLNTSGFASEPRPTSLRKRRPASSESAIEIPITVCHLPSVTSKWDKSEHRLFSFITGIGGASRSSATGSHDQGRLEVRCELGGGDQLHDGPNPYPAGIRVSDKELEAVNLTPHDFHGEWNYTVTPNPPVTKKWVADGS